MSQARDRARVLRQVSGGIVVVSTWVGCLPAPIDVDCSVNLHQLQIEVASASNEELRAMGPAHTAGLHQFDVCLDLLRRGAVFAWGGIRGGEV